MKFRLKNKRGRTEERIARYNTAYKVTKVKLQDNTLWTVINTKVSLQLTHHMMPQKVLTA